MNSYIWIIKDIPCCIIHTELVIVGQAEPVHVAFSGHGEGEVGSTEHIGEADLAFDLHYLGYEQPGESFSASSVGEQLGNSSQLTLLPAARRVDVPSHRKHHEVIVTGHDLHDWLKHGDLDGEGAVLHGLKETNHSIIIPEAAPEMDRSVVSQGGGVAVPGRHLHHLGLQDHLPWDGLGPALGRLPAQRPFVVTTERVDTARVAETHGVHPSSCYLHDAFWEGHGGRLLPLHDVFSQTQLPHVPLAQHQDVACLRTVAAVMHFRFL